MSRKMKSKAWASDNHSVAQCSIVACGIISLFVLMNAVLFASRHVFAQKDVVQLLSLRAASVLGGVS